MRRKLGSLVVGAVEWHLWADFARPGTVAFTCETDAPLRKRSFQLNDSRDSYLMRQYMESLYDWCHLRLVEYAKNNQLR